MKLKELLEQLNQLAKERPEALEMEVFSMDRMMQDYIYLGSPIIDKFTGQDEEFYDENVVLLI